MSGRRNLTGGSDFSRAAFGFAATAAFDVAIVAAGSGGGREGGGGGGGGGDGGGCFTRDT